MYLERIKTRYPSALLVTALLVVALLVPYLMVHVGIIIGPLIAAAIFGIGFFVMMLKDYKLSVYACFFISVFMSFFDRAYDIPVPMGVVLDAIAVLSFFSIFLNPKDRPDWTDLKHPITYLYIFIVVYQLLQAFNPNAVSLVGWMVSLRGNTSFLLFLVFIHMFNSVSNLKKFTYLWLGLALIVALYGIFQEKFGLTDFETKWVYSSTGRAKLLFIWGHMRKFSFLSDPSAFGLFTGFSGLACLVLAVGPFKQWHRIALFIMACLMFISMSFSGTRTAIAMVAIGVAFYIVLTIRTRRTLMITVAVIVAVGLLLFGPFYNGTVKRIRSTFFSEGDASMGVRDKKRVRLQNYVLSHPFGGGINTTGGNGLKYSKGHSLAEGWDADSGYLLTALELGWIGLIIGMAFFYAVIGKGIDNYFVIEDPFLKTITLAYIVPFMALSIAHFAQDAMFQKPVYLVVTATYALMIKLPSLEKQTTTNNIK
ncbi:MAG TPA: O-antigen ligase family protein [Cyclobacteriaceae bacterium]